MLDSLKIAHQKGRLVVGGITKKNMLYKIISIFKENVENHLSRVKSSKNLFLVKKALSQEFVVNFRILYNLSGSSFHCCVAHSEKKTQSE